MRQAVYVEDTDGYSVVYHANYLKYAVRAVHGILGGAAKVQKSCQEEECRLVVKAVRLQRFMAGAILGAVVDVHVTLAAVEDDKLDCYVTMSPPDDKDKPYTDLLFTISCEDEMGPCPLPPDIIDAAGAHKGELPTVISNGFVGLKFKFAAGPNLSCAAGPRSRAKCYNVPFEVQPDECDDPTGWLSNRSIINFFERGRNLNDPETGKTLLGRLKDEEGQLIFMGRFDHLDFNQRPHRVAPGSKVEVRTAMVPLNENTQIQNHQSLWLISRDGTGEPSRDDVLLASAFCFCAITDLDRKPVPIVDWWVKAIADFTGMDV